VERRYEAQTRRSLPVTAVAPPRPEPFQILIILMLSPHIIYGGKRSMRICAAANAQAAATCAPSPFRYRRSMRENAMNSAGRWCPSMPPRGAHDAPPPPASPETPLIEAGHIRAEVCYAGQADTILPLEDIRRRSAPPGHNVNAKCSATASRQRARKRTCRCCRPGRRYFR